ncbi:hypothetical protein AN619_07310 [Thermotalea metallivorans]|uniref:Uncharacterized protein n=1 Tax=Thermotalea metallivorans TaxID=520762 RepID=A0A140L9H6_9FIRM|nr:hypothetical protein AN619_07310 [Thermotalea metallivorans]
MTDGKTILCGLFFSCYNSVYRHATLKVTMPLQGKNFCTAATLLSAASYQLPAIIY